MSGLLADYGICAIDCFGEHVGEVANIAGIVFSFKEASKCRNGSGVSFFSRATGLYMFVVNSVRLLHVYNLDRSHNTI